MPRKTKITDRAKSWNQRPAKAAKYNFAKREVLKSYLIICEGQVTEPEYFKSFPVGNVSVEAFGLGRSRLSLVNYVIEMYCNNPDYKDREIWVVFDFDVNTSNLSAQKADFNQAIAVAKKNEIRVASSNDAFEIWFVLHYQLVESELSRKELYKILSNKWNCNYEKSGKEYSFSRKLYHKLLNDKNANEDMAIKHAMDLNKMHKGKLWADKNPHTTVHLLVKELNGWLRT